MYPWSTRRFDAYVSCMTVKRVRHFIRLLLLATFLAAGTHAQDQWLLHRAPGVAIQYHARNSSELPRIIHLVESARQRFEKLADTTITATINVVAASSTMEFSRITGGALPDWGAAVAVPEERLIIFALVSGKKTLEQSIAHEVSHVLLGVLARERVPRWFDEGLAMFMAGEWSIYDSFRLARGALVSELVPLSRIENVLTFHQDQAWLAYTQSFAAVTTLLEQMTDTERSAFMRGLNRTPFDESLAIASNIRRSAFEENWNATATQRYALVALADDMWIWAALLPGLFLMALVARWLRNRRTVKRWIAEDDPFDFDDDDDDDEPLDERIAETYG
jgi:hypothetical protein